MPAYGYSSAEPEVLEQTPIKMEPDQSGVFEDNPQLQIDFILACVAYVFQFRGLQSLT